MRVIRCNPTAIGHYLTAEEIEDLASGRARLLYVCGNPKDKARILRLNEEQQQEFESAKARGWFYGSDEFPRAGKAAELAYRWLETHRLPNTRVEEKTKYARIVMDLLAVLREQREVWDLLERQDPPAEIGGKTTYWGCYNVIERVPKENGVVCVEWLLARFRSAIKETS